MHLGGIQVQVTTSHVGCPQDKKKRIPTQTREISTNILTNTTTEPTHKI